MTDSPWTFGEESAGVSPGTVTLVNGTTFIICDRSGDVTGSGVTGVFVADSRLCSLLELLVDGRPVEGLAVHSDEPWAATFVGRSADRTVIVRRVIRVGRGATVHVELRNRVAEAREVAVVVRVASDLADVFAVKEGRATGEPAAVRVAGDALRIGDDDRRAAVIRAGPAPTAVTGLGGRGEMRWVVRIDAQQTWFGDIQIAAMRDGEVLPIAAEPPPRTHADLPLPVVRSDIDGLDLAFARALEDLEALRLVDFDHPEDEVFAAGAPWFMTLFGRDSLLSAWMALPFDPHVALATVRTLARLQGVRDDRATEEQPGRILHEVRFGVGSSLSLSEAERYYGTVDATPLFVMLVHELWRWGVEWSELQPLLPAVDAALDWIAGPGDPDGDGFVEYSRTSPTGLVNQGWKDSWDAISFADGRIAEPPIALAEVQGYVYAAWRAGAALAAANRDHVKAASRADRASALRVAFDRAFWLEDRGYFALALDGEKQPVDALASNMGHLLWCEIALEERVAAVAGHLASPALSTGWGVRTLATDMARYDPLGYHTGSVWPHDTALCVAGLRKAGRTQEAGDLAAALFAAAEANGGGLPELFAGLGPETIAVPVPYPASCSPQAWAAAAPLLVLRALLGLEPDLPGRRLVLEPALPRGARQLHVDGLRLGGRRVSIDIDGDAVAVRDLPRGVAIVLERPAS